MREPTRNPTKVVLAAAFLALAGCAAAQDLTIVSKVTDGKGSPRTATSYLASDRVRIVQAEGTESILDFRRGEMTILDGRNKTYYVITKQDLQQLAEAVKERMNSPEMKRAQEQLKNLPPEQRKKVEAAMGGMFGSFDVRKAGTSRRIAGYPCENWTIAFGEISRTEECLTSELQFPVQAWDMYRDFAASLQSMMSAFGPAAKGFEEMQEKFKKLRGFPLATTSTVSVMGHTTVTTSEVTEVRRGPIPASAWEIPAGYRKTENPMKKALRTKK